MFAALLGFILLCRVLPTHEIPLSFLWEENKKHESCARLPVFIIVFGKIFVGWWWGFVSFHSPGKLKNLPCVIVYVQLSDKIGV